ncbi:MAG: hypothetical protein AAB682_02765 [Patescibacteria group bacterium]
MSSAKIRIAHLGQLVDSLLGSDDVPSTGDVDEVCSVISDLVRCTLFHELSWTIDGLTKCLSSVDLFEESMAKKAMEQKVLEAITSLTAQIRPTLSHCPESGRPLYVKFPNGKMP